MLTVAQLVELQIVVLVVVSSILIRQPNKEIKYKYFDMEYNLHNRREIPRDYECCWNCRHMSWMVGIGQGVRCTTEENNYRIFGTGEEVRPKLPVIPGVAEKCEHFESKWSKE